MVKGERGYLPDEVIALHCQSTESDGAGLNSKGSELQELLEIDGEIRVCHGCGRRSRHLANEGTNRVGLKREEGRLASGRRRGSNQLIVQKRRH